MSEAVSNLSQVAKGIMRIYACGGAAINIMDDVGSLQINPDLMAELQIVQIDTSNSNLNSRSSNVENYLLTIAGVDGGGKDRTENKALIEEHTKPILKKHPPRDLNVVLSTGSGSSGSTIATNLVNELLARGESVVVLLIGTTASRKEALNTIETKKNYLQIAKARQLPVIHHYMQNSPDFPRESVNAQMLSTLSYLAILASRRNAGLDTMDMRNYLQFTKKEVSQGRLPAQLYSLTILVREFTPEGEQQFVKDMHQLGNILSVATLAKAGTPTELPSEFMPEYHTEGFVADMRDSKVFDGKSVNFVISDGLLENNIEALRSFSNRDKPKVATSSLLDGDDEDGGVNFS